MVYKMYGEDDLNYDIGFVVKVIETKENSILHSIKLHTPILSPKNL